MKPPLSELELGLLRRFEGLRLNAYRDPRPVGAILTIGYGHTGPEVKRGARITKEQAEALLLADAERAAAEVDARVTRPLTPNQRAALISFAFNIGARKFAQSNVLRLVNANDDAAAVRALLRWCHAGTRVLPGLLARRQAEARVFAKPEKEDHAQSEP